MGRWMGHRRDSRRRAVLERLEALELRVDGVETLVGAAGAVLTSLRADDAPCAHDPRILELDRLIVAAGAVLREVGRPTASRDGRPGW